ncbi:MAG: bifunctional 5,10-methylenetetrahydrofolate dehydrogenase/5,10-methenyltetrahydrofolate cyclohydrolase [Anaerolineae bacterium]|nr:bifunctional 5,10-methylenetetrahydrofolate dehydrogenase/5,10-methenyltetrahydrofolate cyclohydrolase [Anaerolineae bacterium]
MSAIILDGKAIAKRIQDEVKDAVAKMSREKGVVPGLAAVLVGENPASQMYVKMKRNRCEEVGIESFGYEKPADITQEELEELINELNRDPKVHGILIQLPLPDHIDTDKALQTISLDKDVDGFHPINIGRLAMKGREPEFIPATPYGCMILLQEAERLVQGFKISGSNAVVCGRSNIVGMPMSLLLVKANATVTIVHSRTKNIPEIVGKGDIVIGAMGRAEMIKGEWLKEGAICIDVATVKVDAPEAPKGYIWKGDFEAEAAKKRAAAITPVPGGVGPMTIAILLKNTLHGAELALS